MLPKNAVNDGHDGKAKRALILTLLQQFHIHIVSFTTCEGNHGIIIRRKALEVELDLRIK